MDLAAATTWAAEALSPVLPKVSGLGSVKRMRRNGRTEDDSAQAEVYTPNGSILTDGESFAVPPKRPRAATKVKHVR